MCTGTHSAGDIDVPMTVQEMSSRLDGETLQTHSRNLAFQYTLASGYSIRELPK